MTKGHLVIFFFSDTSEAFLSKLPKLVTVTHQYNATGEYVLSISARSVVGPPGTVQQSVSITETPCIITELRMLGAGANSNQCPEIQQEYEYAIYSTLKIDCYGVEQLKYEWNVEQVLADSKTRAVPFLREITSSAALVLAGQSLKAGLYKFTLSVAAMPVGISRVAIGFLRVPLPNLLVTIDCGSERVMPWNQEVVLDGSASRDPNDIDVSSASSSLSFKWFCDKSHDVSCFKGQVDNKQSVLTFKPNFLDRSTTYQFVLSVSKGLRQAEAIQTIKVVDGDFPPLCVRLVLFHMLTKLRYVSANAIQSATFQHPNFGLQ